MNEIADLKVSTAKTAADLLSEGYSRRTTAAEPRLSELVDQYRTIGHDVEVIARPTDNDGCNICFASNQAGGCSQHGDIYVRLKK